MFKTIDKYNIKKSKFNRNKHLSSLFKIKSHIELIIL
jgi:hypothetical protein